MLNLKTIILTLITLFYSILGFAAKDQAPTAPAAPSASTPNDTVEMVQSLADTASNAIIYPSSNNTFNMFEGLGDTLIPIFGIVTPFLVAFLIILIILRYNYRHNQAKYAVITKALELGKDLPEDFYQGKKRQPSSPLESALVILAVGLGMLILAIWVTDILYGVGAICILVGIAKLIAWKIESKKKVASLEAEPISETNQHE